MLVTWRYHDRQSLVQSFDPRAWMVFYVCFIVATLSFWDVRYLSVYLVIAIAAVIAARIPWREMSRAWLFIGGFIIFFSFMTFLTGRGGTEVFSQEHMITQWVAPFKLLGWQPRLDVSLERAVFALSQLARVFSLASMTILIPYTLNPALYGITFRGLGLPDKFAYAMDLTMRFIPTIGRDFSLTLDAQRARGYELDNLKGGVLAQVRKLAPLIVPVTIHALSSSEDIIDAMDLRAFGVGPRTWLEQLHFRRRDIFLVGFGLLLLVSSLAFSILGLGKFWVPEFLIRLIG